MNVDSYTDDRSAIPTLKKSLSDKLTIGGMKEDVYYTIEAIDNELFGSIKDTPKVGERISMRYSFQGYDDDYGQYGYERLYLFIYRLDIAEYNYVRSFRNAEELVDRIKGLKLSICKTYGLEQIVKLEKEIEKYKKDYDIQ